ncbi:hypothetical protein AX774_g6241, partial [Zancudomyces culisetae]
MDNIVSA